MKKYIPNVIKRYIKSFVERDNINYLGEERKKKIYITLAADYGNLGDVAISYAQYQYLKNNIKDYQVVDVPISKNLTNIKKIKTEITPEDIITIVGGGNMTDQYQDIENCRLEWLKSFPNNKIISFPQTIDFTETKDGLKSFERSKKLYDRHRNFHLIGREKKSYEFMKKNISNNIYLCPDIVLSLKDVKGNDQNNNRNGIICCIRNDSESIFSEEKRTLLIKQLSSISDVTFTDTHIGINNLNWDSRISALDEIWIKFANSKLVVTDRLHGMIFAFITNTPCLVIRNSNHKIEETYKNWISNFNYIKLINDREINISEEIELFLKTEFNFKSNRNYDHSIIREIINQG